MKRFLKAFTNLAALLLLAIVVTAVPDRASAALSVVVRLAPGNTCPTQVQTFNEGILTPNASCQLTVTSDQDLQRLLRQGWVVTSMPGVAVTNNGKIASQLGSGTAPTVTTCGTGTVAATSTDAAGDVTATGATACTVVFNAAFTHKPVCVATDETTAAGLKVAYGGTSNAAQITVSGLTSGDEFTYVCFDK